MDQAGMAKAKDECQKGTYFLRFKKVGTLNWDRSFPADASSTSHVTKGPTSSALAYQPWALAELT